MINSVKIFLFFLIVINLLLVAGIVNSTEVEAVNLKNSVEFLDKSASEAGYDNTKKDLDLVVGKLIKIFISIYGIIFFILIISGGFIWMTAGGNTEKVDTARKLIINSVIGFAIAMFAYAITWFVVDVLIASTGYKN